MLTQQASRLEFLNPAELVFTIAKMRYNGGQIRTIRNIVHGDDEMSIQLLTPADIATRLQVHEKTVQRWLKSGKLKGIKLEKFWRIEENDLREFLNSHKTVSSQ